MFFTPVQRLITNKFGSPNEEGIPKHLSSPPVVPPAAVKAPPSIPKGKGKGIHAKAPGKAPPPKRKVMPKWHGPRPDKDWKAERIVPWKPITQTSLLEGSVWHKISNVRSNNPTVPEGLEDTLNDAFMRKASNVPRLVKKFQKRVTVTRLLTMRQALQVDILHAKLVRLGMRNPSHLEWVIGNPSSQKAPAACAPSENGTDDPVDGELSREVLELLHELLSATEGLENALQQDGATQAPSELFLQRLLNEAGEIDDLRINVRAALHIARFEDVGMLEIEFLKALRAINAVIHSKALPILFEGILLVGNYVNASSRSLGGVLGITLESLVQLSNTRCKGEQGQINMLVFVVQYMGRLYPDFIPSLSKDLERCHSAEGVDIKKLTETVEVLATDVYCIQALAKEKNARCKALAPNRLNAFLSTAIPKVENLTELLKELNHATTLLRKWFAEPPERRMIDILSTLAQLRSALPVSENGDATSRRQSVQGDRRRSSLMVRKVVAPDLSDLAADKEQLSPMEGNAEPANESNAASVDAAPDLDAGFEDAVVSLQQMLSILHAPPAIVISKSVETEAPEDQAPEAHAQAPEVQDVDENQFEAPLAVLESALACLHKAAAKDVEQQSTENVAYPDEGQFDASLAVLESVLQRMTQAKAIPLGDGSAEYLDFDGLESADLSRSARDDRSETCSETPSTLSGAITREEMWEGAHPETDNGFEAPLNELESVLAFLRRSSVAEDTVLSDAEGSGTPDANDDLYEHRGTGDSQAADAMRAFESPLAELQRICALMQPSSADGLLRGDAAVNNELHSESNDDSQ